MVWGGGLLCVARLGGCQDCAVDGEEGEEERADLLLLLLEEEERERRVCAPSCISCCRSYSSSRAMLDLSQETGCTTWPVKGPVESEAR